MKYKIGEEDKVELLREFFKQMLEFGYSPEYIGLELACVLRAIELAQQKP